MNDLFDYDIQSLLINEEEKEEKEEEVDSEEEEEKLFKLSNLIIWLKNNTSLIIASKQNYLITDKLSNKLSKETT